MRVLIVEENAGVRAAYTAVVEQMGHAADEVDNGAAGLAALEQEYYEVALLEPIAPGGEMMLRQYRSVSPTTNIIVITKEPGMATAVTALRERAVDYLENTNGKDILEKPVSLQQLREAIDRYGRFLDVGPLRLDTKTGDVWWAGEPVEGLKKKRTHPRMLAGFMRKPNRTHTLPDIAFFTHQERLSKDAAYTKMRTILSDLRKELRKAAGYDVIRYVDDAEYILNVKHPKVN